MEWSDRERDRDGDEDEEDEDCTDGEENDDEEEDGDDDDEVENNEINQFNRDRCMIFKFAGHVFICLINLTFV